MKSSLSRRARAFTLVEMMVSLSLLVLLSLVLVSITNSTTKVWTYTSSRSEQFNNAGLAFEAITRRVAQATLNTYWDYDTTKTALAYKRQSELRFDVGKSSKLIGTDAPRPGSAIFFQAPLGFTDDTTNYGSLPSLMNTWGYFLEFNKENRPDIIDNLGDQAPPQRYRYRLMELMEPSNNLSIYSVTATSGPSANTWFTNPLSRTASTSGTTAPGTGPVTHVLADNIVQLIILPRLGKADEAKLGKDSDALAPEYVYDSTQPGPAGFPSLNQLPPVVQITMVAIDEPSAQRFTRGQTLPAFDTDLQTGFIDSKQAQYVNDMKALQGSLAKQHINFRVFTSNVSIRGARWSPN